MKWIRHILPFITWIHRLLFPLTGGRLGAGLIGVQILLLGNVGRKSGIARRTPLLYIEDGDRFIVVASNAGQDHHPAWWLNVQAEPKVSIWIGKEEIEARARRATDLESVQLWQLLESSYRWFDQYKSATTRDIPIVILEPALLEPTFLESAG